MCKEDKKKTLLELLQQRGRLIYIFMYTYGYVLAWEPRAAKVTKSYFPRLPALERFDR